MLTIKGYLANHDSPLDGGAFQVQFQNPEEFLDWLKNETYNGVTVVLVEIKKDEVE